MALLYLISSYQCGKLLQMSKKKVRSLLNKRLIDFVRDDENIYRISLQSVLNYASRYNLSYDAHYMASLQAKISPWYEDPRELQSVVKVEHVGRPMKKDPEVNCNLKSFGFSNRAMNVFKEHDIQTIEQLTELTAADLMRFHNFGRKTLKETREILSEHHMSLKKHNPQTTTENQD